MSFRLKCYTHVFELTAAPSSRQALVCYAGRQTWGANMARYIFILQIDGEDATRAQTDCADDDEALMTAAHLSKLCDVGIWAEDRAVAVLERGRAEPLRKPLFGDQAFRRFP